MFWAVDVFAGVRPCGADHDAATAAGVRQRVMGKANVVFAFTHRSGGGVFGQAAIAVFDAEDLSAFFEERKRGRADDGVGRRRGATCKQNGDAFDIEIVVGQFGHGVTLRLMREVDESGERRKCSDSSVHAKISDLRSSVVMRPACGCSKIAEILHARGNLL